MFDKKNVEINGTNSDFFFGKVKYILWMKVLIFLIKSNNFVNWEIINLNNRK